MAIVLKPENVAKLVFFIRGEKVMLDVDLAKLYGVTTKALNQAMRRNKRRFPGDFAFRLSREEFDSMRSQIVTTSRDRQGTHRSASATQENDRISPVNSAFRRSFRDFSTSRRWCGSPITNHFSPITISKPPSSLARRNLSTSRSPATAGRRLVDEGGSLNH